MSIAFVSTMNKNLYDQYGKRFIQEFANFASDDLKLFIIFEGDYPEEILNLKKYFCHSVFISKTSIVHKIFWKTL